MQNKNILITICARGGSKGVKNKNIKLLCGQPLIYYTIKQSKEWGKASRIIVSTDSEEIANVAKRYGVDVPFIRPRELAQDDTGKSEVIRHAWLTAEKYYKEVFDIIVDLDVTSPVRTVLDLDTSLEIFNQKKPAVLFSVIEARKNPYFNMVEVSEDGHVNLSKKPNRPILCRQTAPKVYEANAAIYFYDREFLMDKSNQSIITDKSAIYVMGNKYSIDIDTELDFEFVQFLVEKGLMSFG